MPEEFDSAVVDMLMFWIKYPSSSDVGLLTSMRERKAPALLAVPGRCST